MKEQNKIERLQKEGWTLQDIILFRKELERKLYSKEESGQIVELLKKIGIPCYLKGYYYIKTAIEYYLSFPKGESPLMTKELYPYIAKKYQSTPLRVERTIRHAIETNWNRAGIDKIDFFDQIFGNSIDPNKGKPTNSEFISAVAEYIRQI